MTRANAFDVVTVGGRDGRVGAGDCDGAERRACAGAGERDEVPGPRAWRRIGSVGRGRGARVGNRGSTAEDVRERSSVGGNGIWSAQSGGDHTAERTVFDVLPSGGARSLAGGGGASGSGSTASGDCGRRGTTRRRSRETGNGDCAEWKDGADCGAA